MARPPGLPPERRIPLGAAAFRVGWVLAALTVLAGLLMVLLGDGAVASAGAALLALGVLAVLTTGLGLLSERVTARRGQPPAPPSPAPPVSVNGHRRRPPERPRGHRS